MDSKKLDKAIDEAYKKAGHNAYFGNGFIAGMEYATDQLQQNKCGSCKHWVNDNGDFDGQNKGWGYCTNLRVRTPLHQTEYFSNNELNIQRDSIVTSDFKGMLNELYRAKCIHGIFQTGENFGCIHFAQKDETQ